MTALLADQLGRLEDELACVEELLSSRAFAWYADRISDEYEKLAGKLVRTDPNPHEMYRMAGKMQGLRGAADRSEGGLLHKHRNRLTLAIKNFKIDHPELA